MVFQFFLFIVGLVILYYGAEWLVKAASSIAYQFGIRPIVIGLTVVAMGTSMPEFVLNFFAVLVDEDSLAIGNIIGSNITNIALILGVSAILMPLVVSDETIKKEYPMMVAASFLFYGLASDGVLSRLDGGILVCGLVALMIFLIVDARKHAKTNGNRNGSEAESYEDSPLDGTDFTGGKKVLYLIGGMLGLTLGARFMVVSAVEIATILEVQPVIIGLTIVAIGTSLPELAASVVCAVKNESDMSIGNVLGSNMLNILFVVGVISIIQPMTVESVSITQHFPVMIGFALVLWPIARYRASISEVEGILLVSGFIGYILWLVIPNL